MKTIEKVAIIAYGDGGELGSFKVFAESLEKELSKKYTKVILQYVNRDSKFFNLIKSIDISQEEIEELHVFSHAIGAGLFLGYKDSVIAASRNALVMMKSKMGKKITYFEAVRTEVGAVQTDDFKLGTLNKSQSDFRKRFSTTSFIKIWGCNSGVKGWVYSDGGIVDLRDTSVPYYWRAFNETNTPKPSIAQAMAKYFNRKVYGATSGASIEVKHKKSWLSSQQFKDRVGHWPSGILPHRLVPDKGAYNEYLP